VSGILSGFMNASTDPFDTSRSSLQTLIGVLYFCYFWSAQGGGQTLGMRVLNIKVVRTDGSALTILQASPLRPPAPSGTRRRRAPV
jgi:uncharacterized RDD family membrane protein YckC